MMPYIFVIAIRDAVKIPDVSYYVPENCEVSLELYYKL